MVPARTLLLLILRSILLNPQHIVGCRDERKQRNNNGRDADSLEQLTAPTRMALKPARYRTMCAVVPSSREAPRPD